MVLYVKIEEKREKVGDERKIRESLDGAK